MTDLKVITGRIVKAAEKASRFIMAESENFDISKTESKGINDFVTYVDKEAERMITRELDGIIPGAGFMAEEEIASRGAGRYRWIIDPLDGTTNFIHGVHPFSISIALEEEGEIIAGVVFEASGREIFTAWKNGGARLNGKIINVSSTGKITDALIATGFPYKNFSGLPGYMVCLEYLIKNTHGVRRMGSASIDLAYVACGKFDVFYEYSLKPWDVAAGTLLVREAGGTVTDFKGRKENITGEEIIASNGKIHPEILEIINKFMGK
ncbi:MAG: inositol monophosphatase family protein [Bacteroidales bacterium]